MPGYALGNVTYSHCPCNQFGARRILILFRAQGEPSRQLEPLPVHADRRSHDFILASGKRRHLLLVALTAAVFLLPIALYFWLISADSVDMLRADQWYDVSLIRHSFSGTLGVGMLWAQHGENRILFQNLLTIALAHIAHFNVLVEVYLSAVLLVAAVALLVLSHRRRSPSTPWVAYLPVALLLLSLAQGGALYGFAIGWYLIMFAVSIAIFFLDRPALTWIALSVAIAAGVVASFSSLQGMFIWPAGIALLLQRSRGRRFIISWVTAACATAAVYFYGWNSQQGSVSYAVHHPVETLKFFFFTVGDVVSVPVQNPLHGAQYGIYALGIAIVGIGLWSVLSFGFRVDESSARPIGVALVWFGLLFAAGAAAGRAQLGLNNASFSLYVMFNLLILVGSYLVVIDRSREPSFKVSRGFRWEPVVTLAIAVLIGVQVVLGTDNGISNGRVYRQYEITGAVVTANIRRAPDGLVVSQLGAGYESAAFIRQMTGSIRAKHLALFSTSEADWYAEQSLPVNKTPPLTSILVPTDGQTVRRNVFLLATASDPFGVTRVEFVLRGQNGTQTGISRGLMTGYGWLGAWDTDKVPDGIYTVRSVAYAPGGLVSESPGVRVEVAN